MTPSELYSLYPRKLGKTRALKKLEKMSQEELENVKKAILKYRKHLIENGTDEQYIQYFCTFINNYEDWLDDDAGTCAQLNDPFAFMGLRVV